MLDPPVKLRSDLIISRQEAAAGTSFVIKDPAAGRFFRFEEPEHFIAQQLDGVTSLDTIRQRVEEQFGASLSQEALEQFIERLKRLGLLEAEEAERGHQAHRRGRVRGNLLYLRFKAFDPDRLFDRLLRKVWFFFTPSFVWFSAALVLLGFLITVSNRHEIGQGFLGLFHFQGLLLAWLTIILVTTAHEFAHGLTCKRFGGEVHEIGFMLLYFQPAFYCNVSDAWLFPEKSKRLWVTFAGAYFEVFLWAVATVIWRVTNPDTALNYLALVVMATSGIKVLFNFNPLIKLDGYYLLSDYLEIPNLRERSFRYVGASIRRMWGTAVQGVQDATSRERRIYLTYGLLSGVFSYSLLGYIALYFGRFLTERYQGVGFMAFSGLLMVVFQNPLKNSLAKTSALLKSGPQIFPPMKRPVKIILLGAVVLAMLFLVRMELTISGEFTVLPSHNADVRAEVEGIIEEILVKEGDQVQKGDLIARLSDHDHRAELSVVEAGVDERRAKLKMLKAGPRQEEIALARNAVETAKTRQVQAGNRYDQAQRLRAERLARANVTIRTAQERLRYAESNLARLKPLLRDLFISRREFEEAEEKVIVRELELEEAEATLKLILADDLAEFTMELAVTANELEEEEGRLRVLLAGSRPEEIEATEAEIAGLEAHRRFLEDQLQRARVVSPHAGIITTPRLKDKIGLRVEKGDLIAEVHELKTVTAEIVIPEREIADVQVGQRIVLKARAYPARSFSATVRAIAPAAVEEEGALGGKIVMVTTEIDNADLLLKSQMTGNAKIYCGKQRMVDLMTRRLARYIRVEFWSWW